MLSFFFLLYLDMKTCLVLVYVSRIHQPHAGIHPQELQEHNYMTTNTGTQLQEHNHRNTTTRTQLQEHNYKNTTTGTQLQEHNYKTDVFLVNDLILFINAPSGSKPYSIFREMPHH